MRLHPSSVPPFAPHLACTPCCTRCPVSANTFLTACLVLQNNVLSGGMPGESPPLAPQLSFQIQSTHQP